MKNSKLVYGVGVNHADYVVNSMVNGKRVMCPFYSTWKHMLKRCYSEKYKEKKPTYRDCVVCEEWKYFSNFKAWMETQDWQGKQLDKDLLFPGNKIYSPETCVFVSGMTNNFVLDHGNARGEFPIGVCWDKERGKFSAQCSNPFIKKQERLGRFNCPQEAHKAWLKRKRELAVEVAAIQTDERVAKAVIKRYEDFE